MKRPVEIKLRKPDDGGETFGEACKRMMQSTLDGIAQQAAARGMFETLAQVSVLERTAPWWLRWLRPARRWWDARERRNCNRRRLLHAAVAAQFLVASKAASVGVDGMEGEDVPIRQRSNDNG